jgi:ubiquinone/menaquinone biosynthesis C-methylase UbiE
MAKRVCPHWIGYLLLNPLRKLFEDPDRLLGSLAGEGITVLEPGCGMGYFTLPLARMVGPSGRVVAIDVQPKMLAALGKRALKAGLADRIELRLGESDRLRIEDLRGTVDLALGIHMVHEVQNPSRFLAEIRDALKEGGRLLIVEPKGHVSREDFTKTVSAAEAIGFRQDEEISDVKRRKVLLHRQP